MDTAGRRRGRRFASRLEGVAAPGAICLSEDAYRQVKASLDLSVSDLGTRGRHGRNCSRQS
ncbi:MULTISPECIES: hypothetical protein [Mesorhizobium]|uniref:hypothetical protein n=1 Tax=Mesorhizobium TaxID=68287 RepID=UPI001F2164EB|nr:MULTISPECIES: hypothetical protein [Mesorhizobium]MCF6125445.1 hypothetical protein [Mesorhizobium ciceri]MCQ8814531.1 hypothetical protein [Mesorhizobium sp. SEMIA396]